MSKHTPGPFEAVQRSSDPANTWSVMAGHRCVAKCSEPGKISANRENAILFAAAPDLLEALNEVMQIVTWVGSGSSVYQIDVDEAMRKASAALAKAGA